MQLNNNKVLILISIATNNKTMCQFFYKLKTIALCSFLTLLYYILLLSQICRRSSKCHERRLPHADSLTHIFSQTLSSLSLRSSLLFSFYLLSVQYIQYMYNIYSLLCSFICWLLVVPFSQQDTMNAQTFSQCVHRVWCMI